MKASTDDRTNKYLVPEVRVLINSLDSNGIVFYSVKEVEMTLIPQLDMLHHSFMTKRIAELEQAGYDTRRFKLMRNCHMISPKNEFKLQCRYPKCKFKIYMQHVSDEGKGRMVIRFNTGTRESHSGPFH